MKIEPINIPYKKKKSKPKEKENKNPPVTKKDIDITAPTPKPEKKKEDWVSLASSDVLKPTPEEKKLMEKFKSEKRAKEFLKPTPEEEKIMKKMKPPEEKIPLEPTPEEIKYMKEEGIISDKDRTRTGIKGIDDLTGGGFPKRKCVAVVGGPGTGKSIFLMQFLINGALRYNEPGIYITFEETPEEVRSDYKDFNFNIRELEKNNLLRIVHYNPMRIKRFIKNMDVTLRDLIKEIKAKRIAIDSLNAFTLMYDKEGEMRMGLFQLFQTLKELGVSCLLSSESWRDPSISKSGAVEFIADGVVMLYNLKIGDTRVRAVEILKMRGIKHEARIVPFKINSNGIKVFIEEEVFGHKEIE